MNSRDPDEIAGVTFSADARARDRYVEAPDSGCARESRLRSAIAAYRVNMRAGLEPSVGQHPLLASLRARYPRIGGLSAERQRYAAEDERRSASIESLCVRPLALR